MQNIIMVQGEVGDFSDTHNRVKRADSSENNSTVIEDKISSVFNLNNSHLHLMVHWAGKEYSIVFCLARDQVGRDSFSLYLPIIRTLPVQEIAEDSTSNVYMELLSLMSVANLN